VIDCHDAGQEGERGQTPGIWKSTAYPPQSLDPVRFTVVLAVLLAGVAPHGFMEDPRRNRASDPLTEIGAHGGE
jgi:hypothetical protein